MITVKYSLVIEATADPNFTGFFSPDLDGFTGTGRSLDECPARAAAGMGGATASSVRPFRHQALDICRALGATARRGVWIRLT